MSEDRDVQEVSILRTREDDRGQLEFAAALKIQYIKRKRNRSWKGNKTRLEFSYPSSDELLYAFDTSKMKMAAVRYWAYSLQLTADGMSGDVINEQVSGEMEGIGNLMLSLKMPEPNRFRDSLPLRAITQAKFEDVVTAWSGLEPFYLWDNLVFEYGGTLLNGMDMRNRAECLNDFPALLNLMPQIDVNLIRDDDVPQKDNFVISQILNLPIDQAELVFRADILKMVGRAVDEPSDYKGSIREFSEHSDVNELTGIACRTHIAEVPIFDGQRTISVLGGLRG